MTEAAQEEMFARVASLEERVDLLETPYRRRILFRLNGWPRLPVDCTVQAWRPWHRWRGRRDGKTVK